MERVHNYNFSKAWYVTGAPAITAAWDADGEQWTVPAGGGFGRAMKLGRQQVNLKAAVYGNVQLSMRLLCTE